MEARRALTANSISVNNKKSKGGFYTKIRFNQQPVVLLQSGKKNYFVVRIV
jgi:tyrosyl-tRNA synthetase